MTYKEYVKRDDMIAKIMGLFMVMDIILMIITFIVYTKITGVAKPSVMITVGYIVTMMIHGFGAIWLSSEAYKEYTKERDKRNS